MEQQLEELCTCKGVECNKPTHALLGDNGHYKCHDSRDCPYKCIMENHLQYCLYIVEKK